MFSCETKWTVLQYTILYGSIDFPFEQMEWHYGQKYVYSFTQQLSNVRLITNIFLNFERTFWRENIDDLISELKYQSPVFHLDYVFQRHVQSIILNIFSMKLQNQMLMEFRWTFWKIRAKTKKSFQNITHSIW